MAVPTTYALAQGWNNQSTVVLLSPQPAGSGLQKMEHRFAGGGNGYYIGFPDADWTYSGIEAAKYTLLYTAFGLASADSAKVTIRTITNDRVTFGYFNAWIDLPDIGRADGKWAMFIYKDIVFHLRFLVPIAEP